MSRHGKPAPGMTRVTAIVHESVKALLKRQAAREKRTLSNFLAKELEQVAAVEEAVASYADASEQKQRRELSEQLAVSDRAPAKTRRAPRKAS